jgi:hypothetical protein
LALALARITENSGNIEPISKFAQRGNAPAAAAFHVFGVGNIVACVHVIPEIASSSMNGYRRNKRWIVNSHRDLVTWNDVYN